jgi:RNA polymerase sigma-70 factor (ECF subfamily)
LIGPHERSDEELMLAAQSGMVECFEALVSRHRTRVTSFLLSIHPDIDLAEDACQEAFLRLWVHRDQYTESGRFSAYLLRIAKNVLLSRLRGRNMVGLELCEALELADQETHSNPEAALMAAESNTEAMNCLDSLPVHLAEVFRAVVVDGMKYAEAAELLDIPIGTVKSRMHEAVKRLRTAFVKEGLI